VRAGSHRAAPALLLVVALASCGGDDGGAEGAAPDDGGAPAAATAEVVVATFAFEPDPLEVEAGTTITFTNEDATDHTVTAGTREAPAPDVFDGVLAEQGSTFELTLDEPGTYDYFCQIHDGPGMTARIVVAEAPG
jgi:plastocyanin